MDRQYKISKYSIVIFINKISNNIAWEVLTLILLGLPIQPDPVNSAYSNSGMCKKAY